MILGERHQAARRRSPESPCGTVSKAPHRSALHAPCQPSEGTKRGSLLFLAGSARQLLLGSEVQTDPLFHQLGTHARFFRAFLPRSSSRGRWNAWPGGRTGRARPHTSASARQPRALWTSRRDTPACRPGHSCCTSGAKPPVSKNPTVRRPHPQGDTGALIAFCRNSSSWLPVRSISALPSFEVKMSGHSPAQLTKCLRRICHDEIDELGRQAVICMLFRSRFASRAMQD